MVKYGITREDLKYYRLALMHGKHHDYLMAQLAQTYRTRKVMHNATPSRNHSAPGIFAHPYGVPKRLP